ncbi:aldose epimerase [Paenibacillus sp. NPDC058071]|uniref:aldose epimerase family protein n=1 Tax=Paenibacillus sp. NPDC058071 TaxID=3346326 RepID=UPI0036DA1F1F
MHPYEVNSIVEKYTIYELTEKDTDSLVRVCPERGGIVIGCQLNGLELFYLDQETFENPTANIRGGNPILFPISGQLENRSYEWDGQTYEMANHGVARTSVWEVLGTGTDGEASITIGLRANEETKRSYPFNFELIFTYALKNGEFHIRQQYRNHSAEKAMPFYAGFHPYFRSESKKLSYEIDATRYLDYNDFVEKPFNGTIDLTGLVESVTLLDPKTSEVSFPVDGGARVRLSYDDVFKYVVVWSVEGKPFVCVEPWMAMNNELQRKDELVLVQPGDTLHANMTISCDR